MSDQDISSNANTRKLKTYQEARLQNTENLRKLVVDAAATLLQEEGPEAVTVRKVAQKMDCSTKIIYNLFVNKEGLAQQLYLDGCKLLANEFEGTPQAADPAQQMLNFGETFWQFGQRYSSYYKLMFGGAFADFKPDEESMHGTATAMRQLLTVIGNAKEQGLIPDPYDTESVIRIFWASLHGVIHLYMGGHLGDVQSAHAVYRQTLSLIVSSLLPDRST
ncbi:TetR family transcriptional regulator [Paenibacillus baekrokdamisoli]|uniref:TetR family transcriptional regulator n=1 Tax=Paenibacillus baekrokdamisoli TaxID=1712516 RepID=A0A3G9IVR9_9BACL|nr:TetR/AcrR family transcriptional regulator [Paenibacillus baekrokdamisoli]MBB3072576.1 AcrR family transcriptional regulator [Paenibacillus baekrokdamisoli]BBH22372.1 TetR family transcriptional regulator [Paenibacillus baekrokdamisoli]